MANIYKYEIEVKLTHKNTGEVKTATRIDHAYSIQDMTMQTLFAMISEHGNVDVTVMRVGPPLADIRALEAQLVRDIQKRMLDITTMGGGQAVTPYGDSGSGGSGNGTVLIQDTPPRRR